MKKFLSLLISFILTSCGSPVYAQENIYLNINLSAHHWSRADAIKYDFNEINPGLGIEYEKDNRRLMLGTYKNSIRRDSNYILIGYMPMHLENLSMGIAGGAVTGYFQSVMPVGGLLATYQHNRIGVNVLMVPNVLSIEVYGFAGIQLRYRID